jgi:hypothetical protein
VAQALNGFPAESLNARLIPGKWSAREIVHHLGDSESTSAFRLRKLLVEDNAIIEGYDQDQFATRLHYNERDETPALEAFRVARETTLQLLNSMSEEDWQRVGRTLKADVIQPRTGSRSTRTTRTTTPRKFVGCVKR